MTKRTKIFTWTSVGVLGGGAILGCSIALIIIFKNKHKNIDLSKPEFLKKNNQDLKFSFKWYKDSKGNEFLPHSGYIALDTYLSSHLYYGPESESLKNIVFGNRNVMAPGSSGVYFGATRQIFINIENYIGTVGSDYQWKIDSVSEVIAHEYGHHFAHIYLKGNKSTDNAHAHIVYDSKGFKTIWNKSYFDDWIKLMMNNNPDKKNSNKNYGSQETINHSSSLYNLYEMANDKSHDISNFRDNITYIWKNEINSYSDAPYIKFNKSKDDISNLEYFYSADEQFTRLTEMMMWPKNYWKNKKIDYSDSTSFVPHNNLGTATNIWSPQAYDLAHSMELNQLNQLKPTLIYPNYPFGGILFNNTTTTIINNYANDYYNFLLNTMEYGNQISHIYTKNSGEIERSDWSGNLVVKNSNNDDLNKIKLSGYTTKKWNHLKLVNGAGNIIKNIPITSNKWINKNQSSIFHFFGRNKINTLFDTYPTGSGWTHPGSNDVVDHTKTKYAYIMDNFMDARILQGSKYKLYFNNDDGTSNQQQVDDYIPNHDGTHYLTTYEEYFPEASKYWKMLFNNKNDNFLIFNKHY